MKHGKVWFDRNLGSPEKLVFMAIASVADDESQALTVARLTIMTSLTRRAVQNCTKRLRDAGYISIEQRENASSMYRVIGQ